MPAFDLEEALKRVDGDPGLLREVAGVFLEYCPHLLREMRGAVAEGDAEKLRRAAHSLKGAAANFGAADTACSADQLEALARDGKLRAANSLLPDLERQAVLLCNALQQLPPSVTRQP